MDWPRSTPRGESAPDAQAERRAPVQHLEDDLGAGRLLELWQAAPTPQRARRLREATVAGILKRDRIRRLAASDEAKPGQRKQHDAEILASLPGVRRIVLATLLAEAWDALQRRDYAALRNLTGVAPVTRRSGKNCIVVRRQACHDRLANAVYHRARVAMQHDPRNRAIYTELRRRGHSHGGALRSVADRLLSVACAMLKPGVTFNPSLAAQKPA